jgi:ATP-dependent phosphoenolpyruvate carboxykinase
MDLFGKRGKNANLSESIGLGNLGNQFWNLSPSELMEDAIINGQGVLTDTGAIAIETGEFTGRSPKDRFIVRDEKTEDAVWWGDINLEFSSEKFDALYNRMKSYMTERDVYVRDAYACADDEFRLNLRVVTELPWSNQFAYNMFLRPTDEEIQNFEPEWHVVNAPGFKADPEIDGTRQANFAVVNFTRKMIIIGGTGYTGEIKKGIFSVLNYILPHEKNVLSMHCSANVVKDGDTDIFFGLSGTGKTTLSSDPDRKLIGDDEHGWSNDSVFNFEGGCYAKTIDLSREKEPQIYDAIKYGAILENIGFKDGEESQRVEMETNGDVKTYRFFDYGELAQINTVKKEGNKITTKSEIPGTDQVYTEVQVLNDAGNLIESSEYVGEDNHVSSFRQEFEEDNRTKTIFENFSQPHTSYEEVFTFDENGNRTVYEKMDMGGRLMRFEKVRFNDQNKPIEIAGNDGNSKFHHRIDYDDSI